MVIVQTRHTYGQRKAAKTPRKAHFLIKSKTEDRLIEKRMGSGLKEWGQVFILY